MCYMAIWHGMQSWHVRARHTLKHNTSTIISEERKGTDERASHNVIHKDTYIHYTVTTPHHPDPPPPIVQWSHITIVDALPIRNSPLRLGLLVVCPCHAVVLCPLSLQVLLRLGCSSLRCLWSCREHTTGWHRACSLLVPEWLTRTSSLLLLGFLHLLPVRLCILPVSSPSCVVVCDPPQQRVKCKKVCMIRTTTTWYIEHFTTSMQFTYLYQIYNIPPSQWRTCPVQPSHIPYGCCCCCCCGWPCTPEVAGCGAPPMGCCCWGCGCWGCCGMGIVCCGGGGWPIIPPYGCGYCWGYCGWPYPGQTPPPPPPGCGPPYPNPGWGPP